MKRSAIAMIGLFALVNMAVFAGFQLLVSWQYILAEKSDFSDFLQSNASASAQQAIQTQSQWNINLQEQIITTVEREKQSVVNIVITKNLSYFLQDPYSFRGQWSVAQRETQIGWGSGIIVSEDGLVLTNKHVVRDMEADYTVVMYDGTTRKVTDVWRDPLIDIAVLQLAPLNNVQPLRPANFIDISERINIGQFVLAVWNALAEYQNSVTLGILSAKNRMLDTREQDSLYIGLYQTDTSINPGNSGGPLFDIYGRVIGVNTAVNAYGDGIGFALPVTQWFVDTTLESIRMYQEIRRPFVGVQYVSLTPMMAKELELSVSQWALVQDIVPDSSAAQAWLQAGDVIMQVDDYRLQSDLPFLYHVYQYLPGDEVTLTVLRDGEEITLSLRLGTYPRSSRS